MLVYTQGCQKLDLRLAWMFFQRVLCFQVVLRSVCLHGPISCLSLFSRVCGRMCCSSACLQALFIAPERQQVATHCMLNCSQGHCGHQPPFSDQLLFISHSGRQVLVLGNDTVIWELAASIIPGFYFRRLYAELSSCERERQRQYIKERAP